MVLNAEAKSIVGCIIVFPAEALVNFIEELEAVGADRGGFVADTEFGFVGATG